MGGYTAIADASETLVELLRDGIADREGVISVDRTEIALVSPDDVGTDSDVRLSVYLYGIAENPVLSNTDRHQVGDDTYRDPPIPLDLKYLITAFPAGSGNDETARVVDQHRLLGLAMQVLNDNAIVEEADLVGTLGEEELHLSLEQESIADVTGIWNTFGDTPLRPSVSYHVSPVLIESRVEREVSRVQRREGEVETMEGDPSERWAPDEERRRSEE